MAPQSSEFAQGTHTERREEKGNERKWFSGNGTGPPFVRCALLLRRAHALMHKYKSADGGGGGGRDKKAVSGDGCQLWNKKSRLASRANLRDPIAHVALPFGTRVGRTSGVDCIVQIGAHGEKVKRNPLAASFLHAGSLPFMATFGLWDAPLASRMAQRSFMCRLTLVQKTRGWGRDPKPRTAADTL